MTFEHEGFRCDVEVYKNGDDIVVRFFDLSREQTEEEICDLVIVDPGFGVLCLKYKGRDALLSGFLDDSVFSEASAQSAIEFVRQLSPRSAGAYIPYHVRRFKESAHIEYNGEY